MGDKLLVASCAGTFFALDRESGVTRWTFDIRADGAQQFHCEFLIHEDRVVIGTDTGRGNGHALDLETGELYWTHPCGKALSTDLIGVNGTVIGVAQLDESDDLICLDIDDGTLRWSAEHPRPEDASGHRNAPVLVGDIVYYGTTDGRVVGYRIDDGSLVEEIEVGSRIVTSLMARDRHLYGGMTGGRAFRIDLDAGTIDAEFEVDGKLVGKPADLDGRIGLLVNWRSRDSRLIVVDAALERVLWDWVPTNPDEFGTIARIRPHRGSTVVGTEEGSVFALNLDDGSLRWKTQVDEPVRSVSFFDDVMYVGTIPGPIYAMRNPFTTEGDSNQ